MRKPHGIQARTVCWKQRVKLGSSVCHIVSISHICPPQKSSNVISKEQRKSGLVDLLLDWISTHHRIIFICISCDSMPLCPSSEPCLQGTCHVCTLCCKVWWSRDSSWRETGDLETVSTFWRWLARALSCRTSPAATWDKTSSELKFTWLGQALDCRQSGLNGEVWYRYVRMEFILASRKFIMSNVKMFLAAIWVLAWEQGSGAQDNCH